jgi:hypothetical protein
LLGKSNVPSLQHKTEAWELDEELSGLIRKAAKKMRTTERRQSGLTPTILWQHPVPLIDNEP